MLRPVFLSQFSGYLSELSGKVITGNIIGALKHGLHRIQMVLDLHRDASGGASQMRTLAHVDGSDSAQLMIVVGTNYDTWEENLSLALKLHAQLETACPGITRPLQLRGQRFNEDLSPGGLLIEVGAAGNSHDEALTAAGPSGSCLSPMLEAEHQGAAAVLAANVGGFAQIADDALNSQDICGPANIPTLSISVAASRELQEKLAAGTVTATLVVDNQVEVDTGTTYNVTGVLKGKSSDRQILVGGHYDVHFLGLPG